MIPAMSDLLRYEAIPIMQADAQNNVDTSAAIVTDQY